MQHRIVNVVRLMIAFVLFSLPLHAQEIAGIWQGTLDWRKSDHSFRAPGTCGSRCPHPEREPLCLQFERSRRSSRDKRLYRHSSCSELRTRNA